MRCRFLLSTITGLALSGPAFATDLTALFDPRSPTTSTWSAYFDVYGGYGLGNEGFDETVSPFSSSNIDFDEWSVRGAARAGAMISGRLALPGELQGTLCG
jgi:hypothetical protein